MALNIPLKISMKIPMKIPGDGWGKVVRDAAELAAGVDAWTASFPPAERDWLTDPLRHAARSAADRLATAQARPRRRADLLSAAEADLHEVQTWALLAARHHHGCAIAAADVDRRCEAILDALADLAAAVNSRIRLAA